MDVDTHFYKNYFSLAEHVVTLIVLYVELMFAHSATEEYLDFWLCRKCGRSIAKTSDFINIPSVHAIHRRNVSFFQNSSTIIQTFKNPNGQIFEIITLTDSKAQEASQVFSSDTWFTGYGWSVSICPSCHQHLGWVYYAAVTDTKGLPSHFHGLILENLLQEEEANTIIQIPKSFGS